MPIYVYKNEKEELYKTMREIERLVKDAVNNVAEERDRARMSKNEAAGLLREVEIFMGSVPFDSVDQELLEKIRQYLYS